MKKTVTKPDGSTEIIEGTAEEIAEYERKMKKDSLKEAPPKKQKDILKGDEYPQVDYYKLLWDLYQKQTQEVSHDEFCPITIARRGWWSVQPPTCTCYRKHLSPYYKVTYTTNTTDSLKYS